MLHVAKSKYCKKHKAADKADNYVIHISIAPFIYILLHAFWAFWFCLILILFHGP